MTAGAFESGRGDESDALGEGGEAGNGTARLAESLALTCVLSPGEKVRMRASVKTNFAVPFAAVSRQAQPAQPEVRNGI